MHTKSHYQYVTSWIVLAFSPLSFSTDVRDNIVKQPGKHQVIRLAVGLYSSVYACLLLWTYSSLLIVNTFCCGDLSWEVSTSETGKELIRAVPWLRQLVAGLPPRRPVFDPGSANVGFVVDKVALGQVFPRVLRFSPVNFIPPVLHYLEKWKKKLIIFLFILGLRNKP